MVQQARAHGTASRVAVIGNSGGGKSVLARALAARRGLPYVEIDSLLWRPGWQLAPVDEYEAEHLRTINGEAWVIDGLGRRESIAARIARATEIVLIDMPLWVHFWLAAERQLAWQGGRLENPPAGLAQVPPTAALFRTIWDVDRTWMPEIRALARQAETDGTRVVRIEAFEALDRLARQD